MDGILLGVIFRGNWSCASKFEPMGFGRLIIVVFCAAKCQLVCVEWGSSARTVSNGFNVGVESECDDKR